MRMHGDGEVRVVPEDDADGIPYLCPDQRPQDAEMLPLLGARLQLLEGGVRVLAVDRFVIDHVPGSLARLVLRSLPMGNAGNIATLRSVIPVHLIGGNVIRPHHAGLGAGSRGWNSRPGKSGGTTRAGALQQHYG